MHVQWAMHLNNSPAVMQCYYSANTITAYYVMLGKVLFSYVSLGAPASYGLVFLKDSWVIIIPGRDDWH